MPISFIYEYKPIKAIKKLLESPCIWDKQDHPLQQIIIGKSADMAQ